MEDPNLLTMIQAAQRAGVVQQTIYLAVKEGRLKSVTLYGKKLVHVADLEAYMQTMGQANGALTKKKARDLTTEQK